MNYGEEGYRTKLPSRLYKNKPRVTDDKLPITLLSYKFVDTYILDNKGSLINDSENLLALPTAARKSSTLVERTIAIVRRPYPSLRI